eukprot:367888-Rhodomonas_salina.3
MDQLRVRLKLRKRDGFLLSTENRGFMRCGREVRVIQRKQLEALASTRARLTGLVQSAIRLRAHYAMSGTGIWHMCHPTAYVLSACAYEIAYAGLRYAYAVCSTETAYAPTRLLLSGGEPPQETQVSPYSHSVCCGDVWYLATELLGKIRCIPTETIGIALYGGARRCPVLGEAVIGRTNSDVSCEVSPFAGAL